MQKQNLNSPKLLFVCSRNQWRSPTAELLFRKQGYETRSAGTSPNAKHTISVKDIQWADTIFVMEQKHKDRLKAQFARPLAYKKIIVLEIEDLYQFNDPELIDVLDRVVTPYLISGESIISSC